MYYPTRAPVGERYQVGGLEGRAPPAGLLSGPPELVEGAGTIPEGRPWEHLLLWGEAIVLGSKLFRLF